MKKTISLLLALSLAMLVLLTGCGGGSKVEVTPPSWETVTDSTNGFSYEVPADWIITEDTTGNGAIIYIPADADLSAGSSNVNIIVNSTGAKAAKASDMKEALESELANQLAQAGMEASNMVVEIIECPIGETCKVTYDLEYAGLSFSQLQLYPLVDDYTVVITATDVEDGVEPSVSEIAEYMAMTLAAAE